MIEAFREVVVADFEFAIAPGERPDPLCLVAYELCSGRRFRIWRDQFGPHPPYSTGNDVVFIAYYASAELGCYRALGWPIPSGFSISSLSFATALMGSQYPRALACWVL
jgi:hypothetical protein